MYQRVDVDWMLSSIQAIYFGTETKTYLVWNSNLGKFNCCILNLAKMIWSWQDGGVDQEHCPLPSSNLGSQHIPWALISGAVRALSCMWQMEAAKQDGVMRHAQLGIPPMVLGQANVEGTWRCMDVSGTFRCALYLSYYFMGIFLFKPEGHGVVPYNIVYPPHVLYRYVEHFVIFVLCLKANAMWIIIIVPCTSKHTLMNNRHLHVRWSHSQHSTLAHIRYAHTTCQIIVTKDPTARQYRLDWASRARNVHTNKYSTIS